MAYVKAILIGCEGTTERKYFEFLRRVFRVGAFPRVTVRGRLKQHQTLIDHVERWRDIYVENEGLDPSMVECWAVTDADQMPTSYTDLLSYAQKRAISLAFSDPQFECFMLQHFSQSRVVRRQEIYEELSAIKARMSYSSAYDDSTKGDIDFLKDAIDRNPDIVVTAIRNADLRDNPRREPFLTVQRLVERFVRLYKDGKL